MREFTESKVLVVGGAGFVGSNLVRRLLESSPKQVLVVDNLLSAERSNVPDHPAVKFIHGSIADDVVLRLLPTDLDFVFHLATYHGNQNSMHNPLADHENNTLTTLKLLETLKSFPRLKKVVYSSAGCTVAEKTFESAQATEEDAPVSLFLDSPYQISKIIGEFYANYYFKQHNVPVVKARFQNVYGPGEILGAGRWRGTPATVWRNVAPTFIYRALKGLPLTIENGGVATRDFIYVDDIAQGLLRCATRGVAGEVYNLARGEETSILDLARLVIELAGTGAILEHVPARAWDRSGKRFGSTSKSRDRLGFEAATDIRVGLQQTVLWTRQNLEMIDRSIDQHRAHIQVLRKAG